MRCENITTVPKNLAGEDCIKIAQRRGYNRRTLKPHYRSINRLVRSNAKHLMETGQNHVFPLCEHDHEQIDKASLRPHLERDLLNHFKNTTRPAYHERTPRKIEWQDEGRDLAYSDIALPSDRFRLVRRPTLEREEAFHDASTSKGNIHIRRRPELGAEDQQVASLYHMGLLYDSEQDRGGDSFNLNSIRHDEPLYSIRPAKRAWKRSKAGEGFNRPLHLDLSFSDLGEDEVVAQYLVALTQPGDDNNKTDAETVQYMSRKSSQSQPPLRVIYELASSQPCFDIDASQPPDMISDVLSDYDCFSDGESDDTPSQREVQEDAESPPSDAWVILGDGS